MQCPTAIASVLLRIIKSGVLNIRYLINKGEYNFSAIEANHIHNLPSLIEDFSRDSLEYYINIESSEYLREMKDYVSQDFNENLSILIREREGLY